MEMQHVDIYPYTKSLAKKIPAYMTLRLLKQARFDKCFKIYDCCAAFGVNLVDLGIRVLK